MSNVTPVRLRSLVEEKRDEIKSVAARRKGTAVAIFGPVVRGDETATSDFDVLVEFEPGSAVSDLADLEAELGMTLGVAVDVVSLGGLKPRDEEIRAEAGCDRRVPPMSRSDSARLDDILEQ